MSKNAQISVIIPTYNEQGYIGRLLTALERQHYKDFEVIVSDANSPDRTEEEAMGFSGRIHVTMVEAPPKNPGGGRNAGAKVARGDWLLFLDADVNTRDPNFIQTLLDKTTANNWKTSSAKMTIDSRRLDERLGTAFYYRYLKFLTHTKHPIGPGACIFTKREIFEKYGGFNVNITFGEDNDYVTRTSVEGFGFIDDTYYYVDPRRAREEGIKFTLKNMRNEFHRLTHHGKLEKTKFEYEFGEHHKRRP
jgi:glycosyltransferase involved in cell wall biosynthesis